MKKNFDDLPPLIPSASRFEARLNSAFEKTQPPMEDGKVLIDLSDIVPYHRETVSYEDTTRTIFRDYPESKLEELANDIEANGVIEPIVVFKNLEGKYEVLSGKHRTLASRIVAKRHPEDSNKQKITAIVYNYERVSANDWAFGDLVYVNSNLYKRTNISISEKAMAYEMQFRAKQHQGIAGEQETNKAIAKNEQMSENAIRRLRKIIPDNLTAEFINMVDAKILNIDIAARYFAAMGKDNLRVIYEWAVSKAGSPEAAQIYIKKMIPSAKAKEIVSVVREKQNISESDLDAICIIANNSGNHTLKPPTATKLKEFVPTQFWEDVEGFLRMAVEEYRKHHDI